MVVSQRWRGWAVFSHCLEVSISVILGCKNKHVPGKFSSCPQCWAKIYVVSTAQTALITRVTDLQDKQSPWAQEVWDNRAMTGRPRKHIQLGRQLPILCREGPAPSEGKPKWQGQWEGRRGVQGCLTPSTAFPARPPTAEVPETRESTSSKTSCLGSAKAWELNQRPRAPVARDGVARSGLSPPDPAPLQRSTHQRHCSPTMLPLGSGAQGLGSQQVLWFLWEPGLARPPAYPLHPWTSSSSPPIPSVLILLDSPAGDTCSPGLLLPPSSPPPSLMNSHFCNDLTFSFHYLKEVFYTHTQTHPEPPNPRPMLSTPVYCA